MISLFQPKIIYRIAGRLYLESWYWRESRLAALCHIGWIDRKNKRHQYVFKKLFWRFFWRTNRKDTL